MRGSPTARRARLPDFIINPDSPAYLFSPFTCTLTLVLPRCSTEGKIHSCHICKRKFSKELNLKRHIASHEVVPAKAAAEAGGNRKKGEQIGPVPAAGGPGEARKRFACKKCDKVFTQSGNLSRHRLVHTQEK